MMYGVWCILRFFKFYNNIITAYSGNEYCLKYKSGWHSLIWNFVWQLHQSKKVHMFTLTFWVLGLEIGIGDFDWYLGLGIRIGDWDWWLGIGMGIRDWGLEIEIGYRHWGLGIRDGDWDWGLGVCVANCTSVWLIWLYFHKIQPITHPFRRVVLRPIMPMPWPQKQSC